MTGWRTPPRRSVTGTRRKPARPDVWLTGELDRADPDRLLRPVAGVGLDALEPVDDVHALGHLAEDRVLAVEPGAGVGGDDEELRAVRVRAGVGHRERAPDDLVLVDLVVEGVPRSAGAGAFRAPALDHEVFDHAVEREPVVEAVGRELAEVLDGLGSLLVEQLEDDRPLGGLHRGCGHGAYCTGARSRPTRWPLTGFPSTLAITRSASPAGTDRKEKRSSTVTSRTASPSRPVEEVTAETMSATFRPEERPPPSTSFT